MSLLQQVILGHDRPARGKLPESTAPQSRGSEESARNAEAIALATSLARAGHLPQALQLLTERLAGDPDEPGLHYERALTLSDWGRLRESLDDLRAAESRGLSSVGLQINTVQICHRLGFRDEAERRAHLAIELEPESALAHECLAMILQADKRYEEAARHYQHAYGLAPERIEYLAQVGVCKLSQNDGAGAEAVMRSVMSADGGASADSWTMLGLALSEQERNGEALQAFERAEEIEALTGQPPSAFVPHGLSLTLTGRVQEAIELYERYLPLQPRWAAHLQYGFALLTAGRYRDGWEQYEFRRFDSEAPLTRFAFGRPAWNGQCLDGKTLLVWAEQGIGDIVHFARFGQRLKARGAMVILLVREQLRDFAADLVGFDRVVGDPQEIATGFDFHCPLISTARFLCPDIASIPRDLPYLKVDPGRVRHWRGTLGSGSPPLKVGLVWRGNAKHENDRYRSMDLSQLGPLWGIKGVHYVSLQKEKSDRDAGQFPAGADWTDAAPQLRDFRDTAAVIEALDLVICVDTAVAHVAGALGKPVWTLVATASDFRWLKDREDSPWYPTMRLFRQSQLGDWGDVINRLGQALRLATQEQCSGGLSKALLPPTKPEPARALAEPSDGDQLSMPSSLSRVVETRYGMMQYMPRGDDIARSIERYGEWLQPHVDLIGRLLHPGAVILEAQSGIGLHAIALARLVGGAGLILAYEEDPILKQILQRNIRDHRSVIMVMPRKLVAPEQLSADIAMPVADNISQMPPPAEGETIDQMLFQRLDLIKLNEGTNARAILDGATTTLWRLRPKLFLTLGDNDATGPLAENVRSFGYRCWRMESRLFNNDNFNRRRSDIFSGRKATALVAIPEETDADIAANDCVEIVS